MQAEVNGVSLHYVVEGVEGGPWVTFSHSIAADLSFWDAQTAELGKDFRVLRYDTRGHGGSGVGDIPYSLELLARDVVGLWDHLGIARSHFVGLSLGGMTGIVLASLYPERVGGLVVANARTKANDQFTELWDQRIALVEREGMDPIAEGSIPRWFTEGFISQAPQAVEHVRSVIRSCPSRGFIGAAQAIREIDLHARLRNIDRPTLFIAGAEDGACPVEDIKADSGAVPGSRLTILSPAAHISNLEQPGAFNEALQDFLRE